MMRRCTLSPGPDTGILTAPTLPRGREGATYRRPQGYTEPDEHIVVLHRCVRSGEEYQMGLRDKASVRVLAQNQLVRWERSRRLRAAAACWRGLVAEVVVVAAAMPHSVQQCSGSSRAKALRHTASAKQSLLQPAARATTSSLGFSRHSFLPQASLTRDRRRRIFCRDVS